jgi:hypothetical protein
VSRISAAVITLACVVAASCRDGTAPHRPLAVTLTVDTAAEPVISDTPNGPQIVCSLRLAATATGDGSARWEDGVAYWYTGPERTTPVDSTRISSTDLVATFSGQGEIAANETEHTSWYFVGQVPFELAIEFAYRSSDGTRGTARTRYRCGPDPATAVTPSITSVTFSNPTGALHAGDTVSVSYREASSSGVWMTIIATAGAFASRQTVGEHLASSVDRTVKFVVPAGLRAGSPLTITVQAYDAALNTRAMSVQTQLESASSSP